MPIYLVRESQVKNVHKPITLHRQQLWLLSYSMKIKQNQKLTSMAIK